MINLNDLMDIFWLDGDKPIQIITNDGTTLDYDEDVFPDEPADVIYKTVNRITVYDSCVVINLGE